MWRLLLLCSMSVTVACANAQPAKQDYMRIVTVSGSFEEVREDVELAITSLGMVINNVAHIGAMLFRTGKDLGRNKPIYAEAEALEFCSATISRKMMEADPHNIVFCPYVMAVYTLPTEENKVYIAYRRPLLAGNAASKKALLDVEKLLDNIIADVSN